MLMCPENRMWVKKWKDLLSGAFIKKKKKIIIVEQGCINTDTDKPS